MCFQEFPFKEMLTFNNDLTYLCPAKKTKYFSMKTGFAFILYFFTVLYFSFSALAQENPSSAAPVEDRKDDVQPKTDWWNNFFTGGGIGLQFGSYTYVGLSPILGYHFTPKFSGGLGITYIYLRDKPNRFETSVYGGKIFAEYDVYKGISPHIEYELLNLEVYDYFLSRRRRINVDSFLVGASYQQAIGENSSVYIMLLYNVLENVYSPYENPVMRIGFNVGF